MHPLFFFFRTHSKENPKFLKLHIKIIYFNKSMDVLGHAILLSRYIHVFLHHWNV